VDIDAAYSLRTDKLGVFNFTVNSNRQLAYDQQVSDGQAFTSSLGTFLAPKWKTQSRVVWNLDPYTVSLTANHVSSFINTSITPNQKVKANTVFDLSASYQLPDFGIAKNARYRSARPTSSTSNRPSTTTPPAISPPWRRRSGAP